MNGRPDSPPRYQCGTAMLLRAAAVPLTQSPDWWPDLEDGADCRDWLAWAWSSAETSTAIELASPGLAGRVKEIISGRAVSDRRVRAATASVVRYLLRAVGRPTPFGLFAGVTTASWADMAHVLVSNEHRTIVRCDSQWLIALIDRCENCPELLSRLDVVFSNAALRRGFRLDAPRGQGRVSIRYSAPVRAIRVGAANPVRFSALAEDLGRSYPAIAPQAIRSLLEDLVRHGFLITSLRAAMTVTDVLGHVVRELRAAGADAIPVIAPLLADLDALHRGINRHNAQASGHQARSRARLTSAMRGMCVAGRTSLCLDLLLDYDVRLPASVADELARAASALTRLSPNPVGSRVWASYHELFCERYGVGALVSLADVVDPGSGLGLPAGYPGSTLPLPEVMVTPRDERLAKMAWQAMAAGQAEVVLTDESITQLTAGDLFDPRFIQPHVELAASIRAASLGALSDGDYSLVVAPARAAGTLTSRFSPMASGSGLEDVYRRVPALHAGALPVQLSFPPLYPRGGNVGRIPAYLDHVLSLGEHQRPGSAKTVIGPEDVAVTATRHGLLLIWRKTMQVIEPQVFHALALDKQVPVLARFLAHLPRAFAADYVAFDWGRCANRLPYLPQVRYGRTILSLTRWRLAADELPDPRVKASAWHKAVLRWQHETRCPDEVELHDGDLTLRLDLRIAAHAASLRDHLARREAAILTRACEPKELGWLESHCHEIAVPLTRVGPPAPTMLSGSLPLIVNAAHGHPPASPASRWLSAEIYTYPECLDEIIGRLPQLIADMDNSPPVWFVRYRTPGKRDHLRLRVLAEDPASFAVRASAISAWADQLRARSMSSRLVFDTYYPEIG